MLLYSKSTGINWVAQNGVCPAVASISLGGGASTALDAAVDAAVTALHSAGVVVSVAAGTSRVNANSCNYSPLPELLRLHVDL